VSASPLQRPLAAPLAILGGTFDPVHLAHLAIARAALDRLHAASVLWIPTGRPGYRNAPVASAEDRVAMLKLAIAGEPRYALDERELQPEATGYTVDTLTALRAESGPALPLVLLIGTDQLALLDSWSRWQTLFTLAHLAVYPRGDAPSTHAAVERELAARRSDAGSDWRNRSAGAIIGLDAARMDISASSVREKLARGDDVSALLPAPVLDYINARKLYRNGHS